MEQKIKFIIIGLVAILAVSLLIALQAHTSKQALQRDKNVLKNENAALAQKVDEGLQENSRLSQRANALTQDLERVAKEKEELRNKIELILKERDALIEKLKKQPLVVKETEQVPAGPVSEDSYWAGILKVKTDLELQIEGVRSALKNAQINNEQLAREKSSLDLELTSLNRENQDMKRQLEYNKKIMDSIAQELVREKNDKFQIENTLKTIKAENLTLRRQLKALNNRKINLEKKLVELQDKNTAFEKRFAETDVLLKEKINKIEGLQNQLEVKQSGQAVTAEKKESVELPPIVVRPQGQASVIDENMPLAGKIIALNKDNNFVIIDLGIESGIKIGDTLQAYRDNNPIAKIEVIQLRGSIAACDIKKEIAPIQVGDTVR